MEKLNQKIKILKNGQNFKIKPLDVNSSLQNIRQILQLSDNIQFYHNDGCQIDKEDEAEFNLVEIIDDDYELNIIENNQNNKNNQNNQNNQNNKNNQNNQNTQDNSKKNMKKQPIKQNIKAQQIAYGKQNQKASTIIHIQNNNQQDDLLIEMMNECSNNEQTKNPQDKNPNQKQNKQQPEQKSIQQPKPIEGSVKINTENDLDLYLLPQNNLPKYNLADEKTIMVVGATGSGKTTLLNALANYVMGVQFNDPFRYMLINEQTGRSQGQSQTENVTKYYLVSNQPNIPPLAIIDTPGFGDTRGIVYDKECVKKIQNFFNKTMSHVHCICFVGQSSFVRLTSSQMYIFSSILQLFGKDIAENIVCMLTFCDAGKPNIVKGLLDEESPFKAIQPQISDPWFLKFNNSALYEQRNVKINEFFWEICMDNFKAFINDKIKCLRKKSLELSRKVLDNRNRIEMNLENHQGEVIILFSAHLYALSFVYLLPFLYISFLLVLQSLSSWLLLEVCIIYEMYSQRQKHDSTTSQILLPSTIIIFLHQPSRPQLLISSHIQKDVRCLISKKNEAEQLKDQIVKHKKDINDNKNFNYMVDQHEVNKVPTQNHTTTCTICNYTCHTDCAYGNDNEKAKCIAMGNDGNCTQCPKKCYWDHHANYPYILEDSVKQIQKTYDNKKQSYEKAKQGMSRAAQAVFQQEKKIIELSRDITVNTQLIKNFINELYEIALRPGVMDTEDYLLLMIESEKQQMKVGYQQRIQQLEKEIFKIKELQKIAKSKNVDIDLIINKANEEIENLRHIDYDKLLEDQGFWSKLKTNFKSIFL